MITVLLRQHCLLKITMIYSWMRYGIYMFRKMREEKRLAASRGYSDEKISDIFKSQLSDAEFRKHADKVINNGADIEKTRVQLEIILGI